MPSLLERLLGEDTPDELFEAGECRRIAAPPEYVKDLVSTPTFDGPALRE